MRANAAQAELPLYRPTPGLVARVTAYPCDATDQCTAPDCADCTPTPADKRKEKAQATDDGKRTVKSELYILLANHRRWWSLCELRAELERRGLKSLDTAISARLRELPRAYACTLQRRVREGCRHTWEYALGVVGVVG